MKKTILLLFLALMPVFVGCKKADPDEPIVDEKTQLINSLIGTRWEYEAPKFLNLTFYFLQDGRCTFHEDWYEGASVTAKGTYDIEITDGEAWLKAEITANSKFFLGKYALGVNRIDFMADGDSGHTYTVLRD